MLLREIKAIDYIVEYAPVLRNENRTPICLHVPQKLRRKIGQ
jgi:hypothetical protein